MSDCIYGICDGSGFIYDEATNTASDCRCRPQIIARNKARGLSAVVPRLYEGLSFDRYPINVIDPPTTVTATRRFVDRIEANLDGGNGLWFMGPVGTGKTSLAMLVTEAALKAGRSAARYTLPGLLSQIRNTFDGGSHSELLERLVAVDLLHIDDIGAEQTTPWVLEELYTIINARYEERRSLVVTTNILDRETLCEQITERTVSRLTEMCDELPVLGEDRRLEIQPVH
jgi:DNA replication protein DnaC